LPAYDQVDRIAEEEQHVFPVVVCTNGRPDPRRIVVKPEYYE
jgi:hypothetical protein